MVAIRQEHSANSVVIHHPLDRLLFKPDRVDQHESVLRSDCRAVAVRLAFGVVTVPDEKIVGDLMILGDRLHKSNLKGAPENGL